MALRVLLADESNTIKKVFQLALQDYAVEVRPVNIGLDVVQVAEKFNPDIIFADVLLQKKSGYEVCADVKSHSGLQHIPIVLMWSGFMDLDQDRFDASGADGKLEKPFDVNSLRKLIQDLVPKTQEQKISQYLSFPKMPEMLANEAAARSPNTPNPDTQPEPQQVEQPVTPAHTTAANTTDEENQVGEWTIESFDPIRTQDNQEEELLLNQEQEEDEPWQRQDLSRFKVDIDPNSPDDELPTEELLQPPPPPPAPPAPAQPDQTTTQASSRRSEVAPLADSPLELETELDVDIEPDLETEEWQPQPGAAMAAPAELASLSTQQMEAIVREQAREAIESAVWKIVPELAQQIIERELRKILDDKESNLY